MDRCIQSLEPRVCLAVLELGAPIPGVQEVYLSQRGTLTVRLTSRNDRVELVAGTLNRLGQEIARRREAPGMDDVAAAEGAAISRSMYVRMVIPGGPGITSLAFGAGTTSRWISLAMASTKYADDDRAVLIEMWKGEPLVLMQSAYKRLTIELGRGNDSIELPESDDTWMRRPTTVLGGAGNDRLVGGGATTTLDGGTGADYLALASHLLGGAGDDSLTDGRFIDGGGGTDTYVGRQPKRLRRVELV
jgi:hypothetical protein